MSRRSLLLSFTLSSLAFGCNLSLLGKQGLSEDTDKASFNVNYVVLQDDGTQSFLFHSEEDLLGGNLRLRFLIGSDPQLDGKLDDEDVVAQVVGREDFPQFDAEGDGVYTSDYGFVDEDGDGLIIVEQPIDSVGILTDEAHPINPPGLEDYALAGGTLPLGEYDLWAVEVLDGDGNLIPWKTSPGGDLATRFSFDTCQSYGLGVACPGAEPFVLDAVTTYGFGISQTEILPDGVQLVTSTLFVYLPPATEL